MQYLRECFIYILSTWYVLFLEGCIYAMVGRCNEIIYIYIIYKSSCVNPPLRAFGLRDNGVQTANQLQRIPSSVWNLPKLHTLRLPQNQITDLGYDEHSNKGNPICIRKGREHLYTCPLALYHPFYSPLILLLIRVSTYTLTYCIRGSATPGIGYFGIVSE